MPNLTKAQQAEERKERNRRLATRLSDSAPMEKLVVTAISTTAKLGVEGKLKLRELCLSTCNSEYHPRQGLRMTTRDPATTATIAKNGSMIVMGAVTLENSHKASRHFAYEVQRALGYPVTFSNFMLCSISAFIDLECFVNLGALADDLSDECIPHESIGVLIWRPRWIHPQLAVEVYHNGKLVLVGATDMNQHRLALEHLYPLLRDRQVVRSVKLESPSSTTPAISRKRTKDEAMKLDAKEEDGDALLDQIFAEYCSRL